MWDLQTIQLIARKLWRGEAYDGNNPPAESLFDVLVTEKKNKRAHHLRHMYAKFLSEILYYTGVVSFSSLIDGLSIQTLDNPWKIEQLRPHRLDCFISNEIGYTGFVEIPFLFKSYWKRRHGFCVTANVGLKIELCMKRNAMYPENIFSQKVA